jgi:hypothetical protein
MAKIVLPGILFSHSMSPMTVGVASQVSAGVEQFVSAIISG